MPEHLRGFVVVFALSLIAFLVLRRPAVALGMGDADFRRRRNIWLAATTFAFVSSSFWIFIVAGTVLLLAARRVERNPLPLYLFLLFVVPPFSAALPGLGVVNQLFELSFPRLLALLLLLPWAFARGRDPGRVPLGRHPIDWMVLAYLLLQLVLQLRNDTLTNTLRSGLYAGLDALLPYYVASRAMRSTEDVREAFLSFSIAVLAMVPVVAFEFGKQWLLYSALPQSLGMQWDGGSYLGRGDALRAVAATGHPIVLGYVMAIGLFLLAGVAHGSGRARVWVMGELAIGLGLIVSLSRGPWVGAAVGILAMTAAARKPARGLVMLIVIVGLAAGALLLSPWGAKVIDYLPFVGNVDRGNVDYRQQLFAASMLVISQNPLFGSPYFMYSAPMEELRSANLIDVVNTYLLIALTDGYAGLVCFAGVFLGAAGAVGRALRLQDDSIAERFLQGRALLGALAAMLVTIATVSNILFIPILYWCLAGFAVGYVLVVPPESTQHHLGRSGLAEKSP